MHAHLKARSVAVRARLLLACDQRVQRRAAAGGGAGARQRARKGAASEGVEESLVSATQRAPGGIIVGTLRATGIGGRGVRGGAWAQLMTRVPACAMQVLALLRRPGSCTASESPGVARGRPAWAHLFRV